MSMLLKVFVSVFSFLFTAYFSALFFSAPFSLFSSALAHHGDQIWAALLQLIPLMLGAAVGMKPARVAWRLEEERQLKRRAKREQKEFASTLPTA